MGLGGIRIRGMKVIAMAVIEKRDGSEMVENRMGWERYELKKWRFWNDGIKRMGIGGLEMGGSTILIVGIDGLEENGGVKFSWYAFFKKMSADILSIQMKTTIMGGI